MAEVPESPLSKSLREDVESQARRLAAARDAYAARQQAKAAAKDGDGDAKMLPPIEELAVTGAADDAAAQPKESSDESSDDDSRRVAQRKGDDTTAPRSQPATPLERDEMAADWTKHLQSSQLWEKLQSQLPADETGQILELHVQRETGLKLDGWSFDNPYACYKDSQARFDAQERVAKAQAALDAADALRTRCDTCLMLLDDDGFNVGDRVKVGDESGVVTRQQRQGGWLEVRFEGQDKPRSVLAGTLTSLDDGTTGTCFRLGCGRNRCASCQAVNPLVAPSLCLGCPTGIFFPDEAQTVFPPGAPKLFAAWSLKEDFAAELQKDSPDPRAVIEFLRRDLDFLSRPTGIHLSDPLCMKALKDRLLRSHRVGRWLGDRLIGATAWRIRETVDVSRAARTLPSSRAWSLFVTFYVAQVPQRGVRGRAREGRRLVPGQLREGRVPRGRQLRALRGLCRGLRRGRRRSQEGAREARPRRRRPRRRC